MTAGLPDALVVARGLEKCFGDFRAVGGVSFEVRRSEAFGFLGPNGAGKSSTMRMIGATSSRSGGELSVLGRDPDRHGPEIRARLGVVPQEDNLDLELSVADNLFVYGRYFGLGRKALAQRVGELLEFAQLAERAKDRVDTLSGGLKRRLTIARSLVNEPELLLLDEPTTGLDPQARHLLWDRLYALKHDGVTLVLTTHYMEEAEQLCDRLVVMDKGRIMDEGSPRELVERHVPREVVELRFAPGQLAEAALRIDGLAPRVETVADRVLLYTHDGDTTIEQVLRGGLAPASTLVRRAGLEDVFLTLTGRQLTD
ncbi:MAG TPA: ABC transporter ATP-binding protein [Acidimicrobiales bacterium]|nr:ABC transporter ATP-binding protein [Acidimicrobiales bacterium]